jgi:hypothetical protein
MLPISPSKAAGFGEEDRERRREGRARRNIVFKKHFLALSM